MNCTQVEKLLPLYVGHDLNDERERSITAHLQTCARCGAAASEYRAQRQLLQGLAPPAFADDVYAEVRQSVWRNIEAESNSRPLSELFTGWFRPRLVWAVATALLIMVSAMAIYFAGTGWTGRRDQTIANAPKTSPGQTGGGTQSRTDKLAVTPSSPGRAGDKQRPSAIRPYQGKVDRPPAPDRVNSAAVTSTHAPPVGVEMSSQASVPADADAAVRDSEKTLRMEIQTKNPNIRIIWFAQRDSKPASPNSKGT